MHPYTPDNSLTETYSMLADNQSCGL